MKKNLTYHYAAFVLAIVTGLFMVGPELIIKNSLGEKWHGVYLMASDAEPHYLARMHEFYDGHSLGNAYYFENKDSLPSVYYTAAEALLAWPGSILHISIPTLNLAYKFFLPLLAFFIFYCFVYSLTRHRLWSLLAASLVILGGDLISLPDIRHFLLLEKNYSQFARFSRPVNPEFSFILLTAYLWLLYETMKREDKWNLITLSLLFGVSFYIYFYSWTFILALNFIFILLFFFKKEYKKMGTFVLVTFGGMVIGARSLYELYLVKTSPFAGAIMETYANSSHMPIFSFAGAVVTVVFAIYIYQKRKILKDADFYMLGLLATTWLVINQQVLSGITVQSGHYHWYFNTPIYFLILVYICQAISPQIVSRYVAGKYLNLAPVTLIIVCFFVTFWVQYSSIVNNHDLAQSRQRYGFVFDWLNKNAVVDSVVVADSSLGELIPAYTGSNVFENGYGKYYLLSDQRRSYGNKEVFRDLVSTSTIPFRLDYIVWDKEREPEWGIDKLKKAELITSSGDIFIYTIKP